MRLDADAQMDRGREDWSRRSERPGGTVSVYSQVIADRKNRGRRQEHQARPGIVRHGLRNIQARRRIGLRLWRLSVGTVGTPSPRLGRRAGDHHLFTVLQRCGARDDAHRAGSLKSSTGITRESAAVNSLGPGPGELQCQCSRPTSNM